MRITILAVTGKQPDWLGGAVDEYAKRLRRLLRLDVVDIKPESRARGLAVAAILEAERGRIAARLPAAARVIALDERGDLRTTADLSREISNWRRSGEHAVFVIGGPDGLDPRLKAAAQSRWSLSRLTLPHGLAKLILVEQLYRACSLLEGHPYHRE